MVLPDCAGFSAKCAGIIAENRYPFNFCNGGVFDAEGSYNYCMAIGPHSDVFRKVQACKLINMGVKVSDKAVSNTEWYKNRHNFRDVETEDER